MRSTPPPGCYRLSTAMSLFFRPLLANRWFAQMQKMEDYMSDLTHNINDKMPRRGFFGRFAGAMVLAGFATTPVRAQSAAAPSDGTDLPGVLKGRHRQLVDAYDANAGFPLAFAYSVLAPHGASSAAATAVVGLRHGAFPIALGNEMWRKYRIGESFNILDPETKAPAVKNPFLHPKPGVLIADDMAVDRLLANGTVIGACNVALQVQSKMLAANAGVSADEAAKEWAAK